jgi:hypothetical protein
VVAELTRAIELTPAVVIAEPSTAEAAGNLVSVFYLWISIFPSTIY